MRTDDRSYILITRHAYEEPHHLNLVWDVSNGRQRASIEIYLNAADLITLAEALEVFPPHSTDVFLFERGSERSEERWDYYFRLRAFTTNSVGAALHFRFNNNAELPERCIAEFAIEVDSAQLNRLGALLRRFGELRHSELHWTPESGELR
jgi:hypothetical protein